jgi:hypothetical protein
MKGKQMTEWKPVQIFLSSDSFGIFEVEVATDYSDIRCNCATYGIRSSCKHIRFVKRRMDANQGRYTTPLADHIDQDQEELTKAVSDFARGKDGKFTSKEFLLKFNQLDFK